MPIAYNPDADLAHDASRPRAELFPHQRIAWGRTLDAIDRGLTDLLLVMATGTGKTITGGAIARDLLEFSGRPLLWLVPSDRLVRQAVRDLAFVGVEAEIEQGSHHALRGLLDRPAAVVATWQTLYRDARLSRFPRDFFGLIVTDEAHHATGSSYEKIFSYFQHDVHIGLTATPDRLDGKEIIGSVYQEIAYSYEIEHAINDGALVPLVIDPIEVDVDLSALSTRGKGDYSDAELEDVMAPHVEALANLMADRLHGRAGIVFMSGVRSSQAYASALRSLGVPAEAVWGSDACDREGIYERYRQWCYGGGEAAVQVLVNCQVLTEGADFPWASVAQLNRPTRSRALYSQMVGRILRRCPEIGKTEATLVDNAALSGKLGLMTPADLLTRSAREPLVHQIASRLMAEGAVRSLTDAVHEAEVRASRQREAERQAKEHEEEVKEAKRRRQLEVKAKRRKIKHTSNPYRPFGVAPDAAASPEASPEQSVQPATPAMIRAARRFGYTACDETWPFIKVKRILDSEIKRARDGMATKPQRDVLMSRGYARKDVLAMTRSEASEHISRRRQAG